jgi:hypothetical protein
MSLSLRKDMQKALLGGTISDQRICVSQKARFTKPKKAITDLIHPTFLNLLKGRAYQQIESATNHKRHPTWHLY